MQVSRAPTDHGVLPADVQEDDDKVVTAQGLERNLNIPRTTIFRMVRAGQIPHYRIGVGRRGLRFKVAEVLDALRVNASNGK